MLMITRALVASVVIVGTVVLSLAASFGLSVLIWQDIFSIELQWLVVVMAVIVLLAVGSDYNLLVVSRMKEELGGGLKTGLVRAMGATGGVVTAAGMVFAFTMMSMITSDLRVGRSNRHHHRTRLAIRHLRRPLADHAVDCRTARAVVLVAAESENSASQVTGRPACSRADARIRHSLGTKWRTRSDHGRMLVMVSATLIVSVASGVHRRAMGTSSPMAVSPGGRGACPTKTPGLMSQQQQPARVGEMNRFGRRCAR